MYDEEVIVNPYLFFWYFFIGKISADNGGDYKNQIYPQRYIFTKNYEVDIRCIKNKK